MTPELESKILHAKLEVANRYLTNTWRCKGKISTEEIFKVYTPSMEEAGVIFDILPARNMAFEGDNVVEFLKVAI